MNREFHVRASCGTVSLESSHSIKYSLLRQLSQHGKSEQECLSKSFCPAKSSNTNYMTKDVEYCEMIPISFTEVATFVLEGNLCSVVYESSQLPWKCLSHLPSLVVPHHNNLDMETLENQWASLLPEALLLLEMRRTAKPPDVILAISNCRWMMQNLLLFSNKKQW